MDKETNELFRTMLEHMRWQQDFYRNAIGELIDRQQLLIDMLTSLVKVLPVERKSCSKPVVRKKSKVKP